MKLVATVGLMELSFQARSTRVELCAVAVKLLAAAATAGVATVAVFDGAESPAVTEAVT